MNLARNLSQLHLQAKYNLIAGDLGSVECCGGKLKVQTQVSPCLALMPYLGPKYDRREHARRVLGNLLIIIPLYEVDDHRVSVYIYTVLSSNSISILHPHDHQHSLHLFSHLQLSNSNQINRSNNSNFNHFSQDALLSNPPRFGTFLRLCSRSGEL